MEEKIVSTSNGYKVHLRPFISYPKYIDIQKAFTANSTFDPNSKEMIMSPVSANITYEIQEKTIRYLILKIEDKDGNEVINQDDYLPLPPKDCAEVMAEIDNISNEATRAFSKKKETISY